MTARARKLRATLLSLGRVGVLTYLGFCLMLLALQRKLLYFPARAPEQALVARAEAASLAPWRDESGALQGWKARPAEAPAARRLVLFHGNAGHALQRAHFAELLGWSGGGAAWNAYLFEYPGYGARPGTPGEAVIVERAVAAVDALWREAPSPVFLAGESLGAAVACAVARQRPEKVAGLLLITPFNNLADVARHHYPFLPVRLLLRERYASDENLRGYPGPVAFVLVAEDEVVPLRLGRKLYDGYAGRKQAWVLPGVGHNTIAYAPDARWWQEAIRFLLREAAAPGEQVSGRDGAK